jgi:hypothetical protein
MTKFRPPTLCWCCSTRSGALCTPASSRLVLSPLFLLFFSFPHHSCDHLTLPPSGAVDPQRVLHHDGVLKPARTQRRWLHTFSGASHSGVLAPAATATAADTNTKAKAAPASATATAAAPASLWDVVELNP